MKIDRGTQFRFVLRHPGRTKLADFLTFFSAFGIICSVVLLVAATVIHYSIAPYVILLDEYDGTYLSAILALLGILGCISHGLLIFLLLDFTRGEKVDHFGKACIVLVTFGILTIVAGVICFVHIQVVSVSFRTGIRTGMINYKNDTRYKTAVDEMQILHQCCGLKTFRDWFNLQWTNEKYADAAKIQKKTINGVYYSDDVPFSCCDPEAFRPCIHDAVVTNSHHFNYDHNRTLTVYRGGCLPALKKHFGPGLLFILGLVVCIVGVLDLIIASITRVLYTSLLSALKSGDEFGPGVGLLLPGKVEEYASKTNLRR